MASTPAKTSKTRSKKVETFVKTSEIDDDGNFTADIYGESFKLAADANGWLVTLAAGGDMRAVRNLAESMLVVEPEEGERMSVARRRVAQRFHDHLSAQDNFTVEDAMELVADLMEAAGNDPEE